MAMPIEHALYFRSLRTSPGSVSFGVPAPDREGRRADAVHPGRRPRLRAEEAPGHGVRASRPQLLPTGLREIIAGGPCRRSGCRPLHSFARPFGRRGDGEFFGYG